MAPEHGKASDKEPAHEGHDEDHHKPAEDKK